MNYRLKVISVADQVFASLPKTQTVTRIMAYHGFDYEMKLDYLWCGWISKIWHLLDSLPELCLDYTHLMFVDAADVVLLGSPDEVMARYFAFGHPWVFNAEQYIWAPDSFQPADYPTPRDAVFRYLNSGALIGEVAFIAQWMNEWGRPASISRGDQDWYAAHFIENYPDAMHLDIGCKLFQCLCGAEDFVEIEPGRLYNPKTDTYPLITHWNGGTDITVKPKARLLWEHYFSK